MVMGLVMGMVLVMVVSVHLGAAPSSESFMLIFTAHLVPTRRKSKGPTAEAGSFCLHINTMYTSIIATGAIQSTSNLLSQPHVLGRQPWRSIDFGKRQKSAQKTRVLVEHGWSTSSNCPSTE